VAIVEVSDLSYVLPGGRLLFEGVSLRVADGGHTALVGANGTGKTTLLRLIDGEDSARRGHIRVDGTVLAMRQFIGTPGDDVTIRDFLLGYAPVEVRRAAEELRGSELAVQPGSGGGRQNQNRYAHALSVWGEVGGYETEVLWDMCVGAALGLSLWDVADRPVNTLSGGEQKRLALEALFRSDAAILLLDEPDNFLDLDGKRWLEESMNSSRKTILYVSHDRALLANTSDNVVTLEAHGAWTHPESFATYQEAREQRLEKISEERYRYKQEHQRLTDMMKEFKQRAASSDKFASRAKATESRLKRFETTTVEPERPAEQNIRMKLLGGRTGKLVLKLTDLALPGLVQPFTTEVYFGERIGVVGPNGSGKSHLLKLLSGEAIEHTGEVRLGARVEPSLFSQLHDRPDLAGMSIVEIIQKRGFELGRAISALKRYELHRDADIPFSLLSGGQQARFQLLLMEAESPTLLLLDEPTDNLDVESADALEQGLLNYEGTVVAVTHDRWFMLLLDRFLIFNADGSVTEAFESPYI
jgi:ATPase subunit of ABC transporter with duplicated ATPase domains